MILEVQKFLGFWPNMFQGQQDLKEVVEHWKQTTHIMAKWFPEDNVAEKPKDFISKFLAGQE